MREYYKRHEHDGHPRRHRDETWPRRTRADRRASGRKFRRRFATRAERIARLETYLGELQAETEAVKEHIADLKSARKS